MFAKIWLCLLVLTGGSFFLFADRGGWVSLGGEVFLYDRNPWFLKNVKQIDYCLKTDPTSLSVDEVFVQRTFDEALEFWKNEFTNADPTGGRPSPGLTQLATQVFNKVPTCTGHEDLAVKVGYGALDPDEVAHLTASEGHGGTKKVESYIGVSIRKEYDLVEMRGRGTLFIASDVGPNAYSNAGQLVQKAWSEPQLLRYAFIHELGHVFGLPHTGTGLMSEVFLEQVLSTRMYTHYRDLPQERFLTFPGYAEICTKTGTFDPRFFGLTTSPACLVLSVKSGTNGQDWIVGKKDYVDSPLQEIGTLHFESSTSRLLGLKPSITVRLPENQKVFSRADLGFASFLVAGLTEEMEYRGAFRRTGSMKPYPLFANLRLDGITLVAANNGRVEPVAVYSPPSLARMLIGW